MRLKPSSNSRPLYPCCPMYPAPNTTAFSTRSSSRFDKFRFSTCGTAITLLSDFISSELVSNNRNTLSTHLTAARRSLHQLLRDFQQHGAGVLLIRRFLHKIAVIVCISSKSTATHQGNHYQQLRAQGSHISTSLAPLEQTVSDTRCRNKNDQRRDRFLK